MQVSQILLIAVLIGTFTYIGTHCFGDACTTTDLMRTGSPEERLVAVDATLRTANITGMIDAGAGGEMTAGSVSIYEGGLAASLDFAFWLASALMSPEATLKQYGFPVEVAFLITIVVAILGAYYLALWVRGVNLG